jgi:hypothetical protein
MGLMSSLSLKESLIKSVDFAIMDENIQQEILDESLNMSVG